jgi:hypothetical protein
MAHLLNKTAIKKGVKACRTCKVIKPITEFVSNLNNKWLPADCRECERIRSQRRYKMQQKSGFHEKVKLKPDECEACGDDKSVICYDHCKLTDLHRGWLCHKCNSIVGFSDDSPKRLRNLAKYLEDFYFSDEVLRILRRQDEEESYLIWPI